MKTAKRKPLSNRGKTSKRRVRGGGKWTPNDVKAIIDFFCLEDSIINRNEMLLQTLAVLLVDTMRLQQGMMCKKDKTNPTPNIPVLFKQLCETSPTSTIRSHDLPHLMTLVTGNNREYNTKLLTRLIGLEVKPVSADVAVPINPNETIQPSTDSPLKKYELEPGYNELKIIIKTAIEKFITSPNTDKKYGSKISDLPNIYLQHISALLNIQNSANNEKKVKSDLHVICSKYFQYAHVKYLLDKTKDGVDIYVTVTLITISVILYILLFGCDIRTASTGAGAITLTNPKCFIPLTYLSYFLFSVRKLPWMKKSTDESKRLVTLQKDIDVNNVSVPFVNKLKNSFKKLSDTVIKDGNKIGVNLIKEQIDLSLYIKSGIIIFANALPNLLFKNVNVHKEYQNFLIQSIINSLKSIGKHTYLYNLISKNINEVYKYDLSMKPELAVKPEEAISEPTVVPSTSTNGNTPNVTQINDNPLTVSDKSASGSASESASNVAQINDNPLTVPDKSTSGSTPTSNDKVPPSSEESSGSIFSNFFKTITNLFSS